MSTNSNSSPADSSTRSYLSAASKLQMPRSLLAASDVDAQTTVAHLAGKIRDSETAVALNCSGINSVPRSAVVRIHQLENLARESGNQLGLYNVSPELGSVLHRLKRSHPITVLDRAEITPEAQTDVEADSSEESQEKAAGSLNLVRTILISLAGFVIVCGGYWYYINSADQKLNLKDSGLIKGFESKPLMISGIVLRSGANDAVVPDTNAKVFVYKRTDKLMSILGSTLTDASGAFSVSASKFGGGTNGPVELELVVVSGSDDVGFTAAEVRQIQVRPGTSFNTNFVFSPKS